MNFTPEARQALKTAADCLDNVLDWMLRNEPCGYYCDEAAGHVDHKNYNQARFAFHALTVILETAEDGTVSYLDEYGIFQADKFVDLSELD